MFTMHFLQSENKPRNALGGVCHLDANLVLSDLHILPQATCDAVSTKLAAR